MHIRRGEHMLEKVAKDAWEYGRKFLLQGKVADYKSFPSQQHCNISVKKRSLGM